MNGLPAWAEWNEQALRTPWTVGAEEEVMLLEPGSWALAHRGDDVLMALDRSLGPHVSAETHGSALELGTRPCATPHAAAAELATLRARLSTQLDRLGLAAGVAGTHPTAVWSETVISSGARYQSIHSSMRELARREPTFALHVHVAVPTPAMAVRALDRMRAHIPLLLALSANSPYWQGRDTGFASSRTPLFQAFPRVGIPRSFGSYGCYVEAVDVLVRSGAFPEPTFLWWDLRLQPRYGTLEVRVMDAQVRVADTAALIALVQCLVRLEALEGFVPERLAGAPEVLEENRFLAARDGMAAEFVDPVGACARPVATLLDEVLEACAPHAGALGCEAELNGARALAALPGAARQRAVAGPEPDLAGLVRELAGAFVSPRPEPALVR